MKKKGSGETKPVLKNTQTKPESSTKSRGGARPGSGRGKYVGPMQQVHLDLPKAMVGELKELGITNKTEYVAKLVISDLKKKGTEKEVIDSIKSAMVKIKSS